MVQLIKKGGFREKAARQSKYKDSVNHQADIPENNGYQSDREQAPSKDQQQNLPKPDKSS